jgi:hypothetical protein
VLRSLPSNEEGLFPKLESCELICRKGVGIDLLGETRNELPVDLLKPIFICPRLKTLKLFNFEVVRADVLKMGFIESDLFRKGDLREDQYCDMWKEPSIALSALNCLRLERCFFKENVADLLLSARLIHRIELAAVKETEYVHILKKFTPTLVELSIERSNIVAALYEGLGLQEFQALKYIRADFTYFMVNDADFDCALDLPSSIEHACLLISKEDNQTYCYEDTLWYIEKYANSRRLRHLELVCIVERPGSRISRRRRRQPRTHRQCRTNNELTWADIAYHEESECRELREYCSNHDMEFTFGIKEILSSPSCTIL